MRALKALTVLFMSAAVGCTEAPQGQSAAAPEAVTITETPKVDSASAYYANVHLKQSHFSLSIGTHIKDAMNAADFSLPVSAEKYKELRVGQNIVDDFRGGSLLTSGSFGSTDLKVTALPPVKSSADKSSYDVELELKQSHFSLSLGKHLKDAMNAVTFKWSVPGNVYNNLSVGDDLIENGFRAGSLIVRGSVGSWHLKVVSKDGVHRKP